MNPLKKEVRLWVSLTVVLFGISLYVHGASQGRPPMSEARPLDASMWTSKPAGPAGRALPTRRGATTPTEAPGISPSSFRPTVPTSQPTPRPTGLSTPFTPSTPPLKDIGKPSFFARIVSYFRPTKTAQPLSEQGSLVQAKLDRDKAKLTATGVYVAPSKRILTKEEVRETAASEASRNRLLEADKLKALGDTKGAISIAQKEHAAAQASLAQAKSQNAPKIVQAAKEKEVLKTQAFLLQMQGKEKEAVQLQQSASTLKTGTYAPSVREKIVVDPAAATPLQKAQLEQHAIINKTKTDFANATTPQQLEAAKKARFDAEVKLYNLLPKDQKKSFQALNDKLAQQLVDGQKLGSKLTQQQQLQKKYETDVDAARSALQANPQDKNAQKAYDNAVKNVDSAKKQVQELSTSQEKLEQKIFTTNKTRGEILGYHLEAKETPIAPQGQVLTRTTTAPLPPAHTAVVSEPQQGVLVSPSASAPLPGQALLRTSAQSTQPQSFTVTPAPQQHTGVLATQQPGATLVQPEKTPSPGSSAALSIKADSSKAELEAAQQRVQGALRDLTRTAQPAQPTTAQPR
ncbi:hypothetical protein K2X40_04205 [Candidatus Babeliales bacterium]|nr:hypothetical protein [Candidatus Babeliales bacterium]